MAVGTFNIAFSGSPTPYNQSVATNSLQVTYEVLVGGDEKNCYIDLSNIPANTYNYISVTNTLDAREYIYETSFTILKRSKPPTHTFLQIFSIFIPLCLFWHRVFFLYQIN